MLRPCLRYLSAVARGMFRPSNEVCFDLLELCFRQSSIYSSTVPQVCLDRARGIFRPSSRYVLTDLVFVSTMNEVCFDCCSRYDSTVLEMYFDCARSLVRRSLEVCFDRARSMFRPCSRYILTVLEVCFDGAGVIF